MEKISASLSVNDVLRLWPASAPVLSQYGLDFCCGGGLSLTEAAASTGADLAKLLNDLRQTVAQLEGAT